MKDLAQKTHKPNISGKFENHSTKNCINEICICKKKKKKLFFDTPGAPEGASIKE